MVPFPLLTFDPAGRASSGAPGKLEAWHANCRQSDGAYVFRQGAHDGNTHAQRTRHDERNAHLVKKRLEKNRGVSAGVTEGPVREHRQPLQKCSLLLFLPCGFLGGGRRVVWSCTRAKRSRTWRSQRERCPGICSPRQTSLFLSLHNDMHLSRKRRENN